MRSSPPFFTAHLLWNVLSFFFLTISGVFGQTPWLAKERVGNEMRFLYASQIRSYDLLTESWLPVIALPGSGATAMASDAQGSVVAYGTSIYRYAPGFAGEELVGSAAGSIGALFLDGNLLISLNRVNFNTRVTVFNRLSGATISTIGSNFITVTSCSHARLTNVIFGRTDTISPDFSSAVYTEAGVPGGFSTVNGGNNFPSATKTWVFPDESRVVDSAGIVYAALGMKYLGSLAGAVTDIAFSGDQPVVLRGGELIRFSASMIETGRGPVGVTTGAALAVEDGKAFVFSPGIGNPAVTVVGFAALVLEQPGPAVDPNGLAFAADRIFPDKDGNLLLFSKGRKSLFRWSPSTRQYTGSVPLLGAPDFAAYSAENDSAYFAYSAKTLSKVDLGAANPVEAALFNLPTAPRGFTMAGEFPAVVTGPGMFIFSPAGESISIGSNSRNHSVHNTWDPVKRRIYHFRDGISGNNLLYETIGPAGEITGGGEAPNLFTEFAVAPPIRVSPDGSEVLLGTGLGFNGEGLIRSANLANGFADAVWTGGRLVTLRLLNGLSQLQTWEGSGYLPGPVVRQFTGTPLGLFDTPSGVVVVTAVDGQPRFTLLDTAFQSIFTSPTRPASPAALTVGVRTVSSVALGWQDLSGNEEGFRVESRTGAGEWAMVATVEAGATGTVVPGLVSGTNYEIRVSSMGGGFVSAPSASVFTKTLGSPNDPGGEPYNLRVTRIYDNRITLEWDDTSTNETGFRIYRYTTGGPAQGMVQMAPAGSAMLDDTGLAAGTAFSYRIQVVNGAVDGDLSALVNANTLSIPAIPAAPSGLTATANGGPSAVLKWNDHATNEDEFIVERSGVPAAEWVEVGRPGFNVRTYTDTAVAPDVSYTYRVKASNGAGASTFVAVEVKIPGFGGAFAGHAMRSGDIYYFAFSGPDRIERYDLSSRSWLAPVTLQAAATALWVDEWGIFVAEDRLLVRFGLDGGSRISIRNSNLRIVSIVTLGETLVFQDDVYNSGSYTSLDRRSGAHLSTFRTDKGGGGESVSLTTGRIFSRSTSSSPSDIIYMEIGADGKFVKGGESPYHGNYPDASRSFLFPNGARVADDSGTVYSADSLAYNNSLGGPFTDLAFLGGDVPIVLRNDKLLAYNNALLEAGSFSLAKAGLRVAVSGPDAVVFSADGTSGHGLSVRAVPLNLLSAPVPDMSVDPTGLAYTPDDVFPDKDGNILLLDKSHLSLFRWSSSQLSYLPTLPLAGAAGYAAYSQDNHSVYFAYDGQVVRRMSLADANPVESQSFALTGTPRGIVMAGEFPCLLEGSQMKTYSPAGANLSTVSGSYHYGDYSSAWDGLNRRVYHLNSGSARSFQYNSISGSGLISGTVKCPYQEFVPLKPVRVSPDGSKVVTGNGLVFNSADLTSVAPLANGITDAAWFAGKLVTARPLNGGTQIQTWSETQFVAGPLARQLGGTPVRLLTLDSNRLLLVNLVNGEPAFTILNASLETVHASPTKPLPPRQLAAVNRTTTAVSLGWKDGSDNEDGFRIKYRPVGGAWTVGGSLVANATAGTVTGLLEGTLYEFEVAATLGGLVSAPAVASAMTLASPDQPVGEPYGLRITRVFGNSITLEWQDNAVNETGFRILQSTTANGIQSEFIAPAGATSFTSTGLAFGSPYHFRIQVVNGSVSGDMSNQVSATTPGANLAPAAPSILAVLNAAAGSVSLAWKDNSSNEDGFLIGRATEYHAATYSEIGSVPYNSTSFTDSTVAPGTTYYYRLIATNAFGSSSPAIQQITTPKTGGEFSGHSIRAGDVYYFVFTGPDRIERYDLVSRSWLAAIPLQTTASALWVDESGIFVAEDRAVVRYALGGSGRTSLANADLPIKNLFTLNQILVFGTSGHQYTSVNKLTGASLSTPSYHYSATGFSTVPGQNRAFFRDSGSSSPDIHSFEFNSDGIMTRGMDSPYSNTYPSASRTFTFPDGRRVVDDSGTIYSTESLGYSNSLGGSFTDLSFHGLDIPVVLRGRTLHSYDNRMARTGTFGLGGTGLRLAVSGTDVLVFIGDNTDAHGLVIQSVPLSALSVSVPGQPVDPRGLSFTPDDVLLDRDGNLLLPSNAQMSLFRWSTSQLRYLPTIPLIDTPRFVDYAKEDHLLYSIYGTGIVRTMGLAAASPVEAPLFLLPNPPRGFALAGGFPYFSASPGLMTFSPVGANISTVSMDYGHGSYNNWDPVKRRVYHFRDGVNPNTLCYDAISGTGAITESVQALNASTFTVAKPIRVSPDGSKVVVGTGVTFETANMTRLTPLSNAITDALWRTNELLTIRATGTQTQIQRWNPQTFSPGTTALSFPGAPLRLLALDSQRSVLVTLDQGKPRFRFLNADLSVAYDYVPGEGIPPSAVEDMPYTWAPPDLWSLPTSGPLTLTAPVLPSWLSFTNGVLSGTPREADSGSQAARQQSHRAVLRAEDSQGNSSEKEFDLTVAWQNDVPAFSAAPPAVVANARADASKVELKAFLIDPDALDEHTWRIVANTDPAIFSSISVDEDGALTVAYAHHISGSSEVTLEVADAAGATARTQISITLPAIPPPTVKVDPKLRFRKATGLYEQTITIKNVAGRDIAGFDLTITGLRTGERLKNGTSVTKGGGSLAYRKAIRPGSSVTLVLKYSVPKKGKAPSPTIRIKLAVPTTKKVLVRSGRAATILTQPVDNGFSISRCERQVDGSVKIEFPTELNENYRVHYSDDANHWTECSAVMAGTGATVEWTDRGPPWTNSPPASTPFRFYRVERLAP